MDLLQLRHIGTIASFPNSGGRGRGAQLTRDGGYAPVESWDGRRLFFIRFTGRPVSHLMAASKEGGEETVVGQVLQGRASVAATRSGLYFIRGSQNLDDPAEIVHLDSATGALTGLMKLQKHNRETAAGFSVSPDERYFLYALYELDTDLMLVENFP